jgi:glycosyltransferase involved in cell wall biosynthesis
MILSVTRDFSLTSGRKLAVNFLACLLPEMNTILDKEISIISCDELPFISEYEESHGVSIYRLPSVHRIASPKVYGDDWFKQTKHSFGKTVLQKHIDFVKVLAKLMGTSQEVEVVHWFDLFTPLVNLMSLLHRLQRARNFATLVALNKSNWSPNYELIRSFVGGLDRVIVNTRSLEDFLVKSLSIPNEKVECIPTGVDLSVFTPVRDKAALKKSVGIEPSRKVVSWFGPISPSEPRDLYLLIDSIRRIRISEFRPLFLFAFKYGVPQQLTPDSADIKFLSGLRNAKEILDVSDVVVLPFSQKKHWISYQPLTAIEALACGVPVVSMNYPGINEAVTDQSSGILMHEPGRLVDAAISLCKQDDKLKQMSENARVSAENYYDIRESARAYARLWEY